ncbi:branched-chain amino acid ABC transporter permease [Pseudonocardia sulfidoxydans NBRC 16205]|uniref:Branched-chain amino acid ABC transporter permease n=1 Tax=Pseudonocardia sulfidoxydans NBRC 16205 TaxID=1223511 RepID=A0A511D8V2_9PSEU|nr:branched-chain amino acid ABC transporter permease [Pseudonocardia sulfidoxydans]GEL21230.1 branched-chain amino acid ABC transporter permease [Pseudonocardia sulfidoxydans NBRC 16205]
MPLANIAVSAIELGLFYALLALAFLLVLEGSAFFNFGIGPCAMFAPLFATWLVRSGDVPVIPAILAGILGAVVLSVLTEVLVIRSVERKSGTDPLPALVAVVAVLFIIEQLAGLIFGRALTPGQHVWRHAPFRFAGIVVTPAQVLLTVVTLATFVLVATWARRSSTGRLLRAVGDHQSAARLLGLPVARVRLLAFGIAGLIAGIAGVLFAPKAGVHFQTGLTWSLWGFLALVVGGTGSFWGPLAGGLLLAFAQTFASYWFGSAATDYLTLAVALAFFVARPTGLFTRTVRV